MRLLAVLLLFSWTAPAYAQGAGVPAAVFNQPLTVAVLTSALDFMTPRTLDPVTVPQLTLWGLRGLTALDPAVTTELRENTIELSAGDRLVLSVPTPADQNSHAWAETAVRLCAASIDVSEAIQRAGTQGIIRSFFDEVFNHLDPYSRYEPPAAATTEREHRAGQAGLGLAVTVRGGSAVVSRITPDSPADDADIRPGDVILSVDGESLGGKDTAAVTELLSGDEDTEAKLAVRGRDRRVRTLTLTRALVAPQTVQAERLGTILIIQISGFSRNTDQQVLQALRIGLHGRAGAKGVVFDLRGNRGGLLRQAVAVADLVLESGIVATTLGRNPGANRAWLGGEGDDAAGGRPIVILVDGRTASAAEIVAAALADSDRAVVVGSSTLGKGLVQAIDPLPDGGELFLTWSRVLAPLGWPLQGLGVLPQVCTSMGRAATDRQLQALQSGELPMRDALMRERQARAPIPAAQVVELRSACPAAEGRDDDIAVARFLIDHPKAYQAALIDTLALTKH